MKNLWRQVSVPSILQAAATMTRVQASIVGPKESAKSTKCTSLKSTNATTAWTVRRKSMNDIPSDKLKAYKRKANKAVKSMRGRKWETPILLQVGHKRCKLWREKRDEARPWSADVCVFDSGCSKSIILKKFTYKKKHTELEDKDQVTYKTYGGNFTLTAVASVVALKFIVFDK